MFFNRMVLPFPIWFCPPLLDYDVSLYILVEVIVTIPTNPRSSKTESGCERYMSVFILHFLQFSQFRPLGRNFRPPGYFRPNFRPKVPDHVQRLPRASGSLRGVRKFRGKCRNFRPAQEKLPPTVGKVGDLFKGSSSP